MNLLDYYIEIHIQCKTFKLAYKNNNYKFNSIKSLKSLDSTFHGIVLISPKNHNIPYNHQIHMFDILNFSGNHNPNDYLSTQFILMWKKQWLLFNHIFKSIQQLS